MAKKSDADGSAVEMALPRGVTVREFGSERRLQVAFSFDGVECRELMPPGPITKSAIAQAAGLRAEIRRRIALGTFVYAEYFPKSPKAAQFSATGRTVMMGKLLDEQLRRYEAQADKGVLARSTFEGYRKAILSDRIKPLRDRQVSEVTPAVLRDWIRSLDVTTKRARNLMIPLRSLFEDALNDDLIESNPLDRVALAKLLRETTKVSDYEADPFDSSEREALLAAARPDERPMVAFWLETGLRPGELLALTWQKINWQLCRARIDTNFVAGEFKAPKTSAGVRDVDLSPAAMAALREQHSPASQPGARIWINPRTGEPWTSDERIRRTVWIPLCERARVRYRNPYQVRHTYASTALTAGANPWYVAQQLGHADVQMVFTVYGKFIHADYNRPRFEPQNPVQPPKTGPES